MSWQSLPLPKCVRTLKAPAKIARKDFQQAGTFPVISQEADKVNGYWSRVEDVLRVERPIILYGDHTQVVKYIDFDFVVGADGTKLLEPREFLLPRYLYYYLLGNPVESLGYARHFRLLKELEVRYPPLAEQKRIVAILDEAFEAIDTATAHAQKNLANARELFQSQLDRTIASRNHGWLDAPLHEYVTFIDYRGRTPAKTESGIPLITAKNVRMGYLQRKPEEFVDPSIYDQWMARGIPKEGDVLFTTEAPLGFVAQLDTSEHRVFAQRIITLQPDRDALDPTFLKFALMSKIMQRRIHAQASGATAQGIKASRLKQIRLPFPKALTAQQRIAQALEDNASECDSLALVYERRLALLAELKQSILHKAFTGELTSDSKGASRELVAI